MSSELKLIPLITDFNNKFQAVPGYFISYMEGDIYKKKSNGEFKLIEGSVTDKGYIKTDLTSSLFESNNDRSTQRVQTHRVCYLSHLFLHPDNIYKLKFADIPEEDIKNTPRSVLEALVRRQQVNHIDHDKENYNYNNLELVNSKENQQAAKEFYNDKRI